MESVYQHLADRVQAKWAEKQSQGQNRIIIALAGPPGSGKSTIAQNVVKRIRSSHSGLSVIAIPADGFHLPRAALRALPNAEEAIARRGAPWTFDGKAIVRLVHQLRRQAGRQAVAAPTFDHAVKDPVQNGLEVDAETQVCLLEGNYLLSDDVPWADISDAVDDRWLVKVDLDLARKRIAARHLSAGIEDTMEGALKRADDNDLVNGQYVMCHSEGRCDVLVESVEEDSKG